MPPLEQRYYVVQTSRLMCGGRLFQRGDILAARSVLGPFGQLLRSGAIRSLPSGLNLEVAAGEVIDFDETTASAFRPY